MNKVFITGGSGFIGSHFHDVIPHSNIINFDLKKPLSNLNSSFIQGDIRDINQIRTALKAHTCDTILALAAEHKDFGLTKDDYFKTNALGTKNLCDVATEFNIDTIIFYSSVAVYGNNVIPSNECMDPNPSNYYGESKFEGEKHIMKWVNEAPNRKAIIVRPAVVYGERNIANMFRLIQQIKSNRYFNIGNGKNVKSIAYVKNLVEATLFLTEHSVIGCSVYNYADSPQLSSREISNLIVKNLGNKQPLTIPYWVAYLLGLPFDLLIKITKKDLPISTSRIKKFCTETYHEANKIFTAGFVPRYTNEEGLFNMVKWLENEYDSNQFYHNV